MSPLYLACYNGHAWIVHLLLQEGADINLCAKGGINPLHVACYKGYDDVVLCLLTNGADINSCTEDGITPLDIALEEEHNGTVDILMNREEEIYFGIESCRDYINSFSK